MNNELICRVCLVKDTTAVMQSLAVQEIRDLLFECTNVLVHVGDKYPQQMCNKCLIKCKISSKLKELAQKSDRQLRLTEEQEMDDREIVTVKEEEFGDDEEEKLIELEGYSRQIPTGAVVSPRILPQGPSQDMVEKGLSMSNTDTLSGGSESISSVSSFLEGLNLSHLIDLFEQEKITLEMLGEMGHKHLSYVGVSAYGDRYTLLKGINQQDHYGEGEGSNGMQSVTIYTVTPGHSRLHQVGRSPRVRNKKKGDINHPKSTEWPIQCFYCGKLGHKQRSCWHFKTINQQGPPNKKGKREM